MCGTAWPSWAGSTYSSIRRPIRQASNQSNRCECITGNPPCSGPLQGPRTGRIEQAYSSLIAASDCAHTPVISLNRHRPTAAAVPAVIGIVVIASVMAFTVSGSADVNPNAVRTNVHTLSEGRCRSRRSHCANQSKRDQRGFNPHGQVLSVPSLEIKREGALARSQWNLWSRSRPVMH